MKTSDPLFSEAAFLVVDNQSGSTSFLQRKLKIGYNRASRIMLELENANIISQYNVLGGRQVLINTTCDLKNILDLKNSSSNAILNKGLELKTSKANTDSVNSLNQNLSFETSKEQVKKYVELSRNKNLIFIVVVFLVLNFSLIYMFSNFEKFRRQFFIPDEEIFDFLILTSLGLITYLFWLLKDTRFGYLWKVYKLFWVVLFVTLFINYSKKQLKEWLEK